MFGLKKNPAKGKKEKPEVIKPASNPLIKTIDEVAAMTMDEKSEFRRIGGTTISNPQ